MSIGGDLFTHGHRSEQLQITDKKVIIFFLLQSRRMHVGINNVPVAVMTQQNNLLFFFPDEKKLEIKREYS